MGSVMFYQRSEPPQLSEAGLQGFWVSGNAPLLEIEELPAGPAQAAVLLHTAGYGELHLTVVLRSNEAGDVAIFAYQGGLEGCRRPSDALDLAREFTASLGFEFAPGQKPQQRVQALATWREWMGVSAASASLQSAAAIETEDEYADTPGFGLPPAKPLLDDEPLGDELLLDEVAELPAPASPSGRRRGGDRRRSARQEAAPGLTKFRGKAAPDGAPAATPGKGSQLGRIPLRRMRAPDAPAKPGLLSRLLRSF